MFSSPLNAGADPASGGIERILFMDSLVPGALKHLRGRVTRAWKHLGVAGDRASVLKRQGRGWFMEWDDARSLRQL